MDVQAGQPLLRLEDDILIRNTESGRLQLAEAHLVLRHVEARKQQEVEKLAIHRDITQYKLALAQESVTALTTQHDTAKSERDRMRRMLQSGIASQGMFDEATARYAQVNGELKQARAELNIAEAAVRSVQSGLFFDGDRLAGDLPRYTAEVEEARDRVHLAEQALQAAERRASRLTCRAPFSGQVVKIAKTPGSTVARGETIAWIENHAGLPAIDAFLTQDEVAHVGLGSQATVVIPALNQSYQAQVTRIDRASGFLNEMQKRDHRRDSIDKSARVRLAFLGLTPGARLELTEGMPAVLNMPKRHTMFTIASSKIQ
jgi:multidrug resistance efflux pump